MSIWKKITVAFILGSSLGIFGTYSTVAVAVESREGSRKAVEATLKIIDQGIAETKNGSTAQEIKVYYFEARQMAKDINGESIAVLLQQGSDALMGVSRALKPNDLGNTDMDKVLEAWEESRVIFEQIQAQQH